MDNLPSLDHWSRDSGGRLEIVPPEVLLMIAKELSVKTCCYLAMTSKQYSWLLRDSLLWQHFAKRDLDCPDHVFARMNDPPACQVYAVLSRCQVDVVVEDTTLVQKCNKNIIRGCFYCLEHCKTHNISVCKYCETHICFEVLSFCEFCWKTQAYRDGCSYKEVDPETSDPIFNQEQCGAKCLGGYDYCWTCLRKYYFGQSTDGIQVVLCPEIRNGRYYMILYGYYQGYILSHRNDGKVIACGKMCPVTMLLPFHLKHHKVTSIDQLIPLNEEEMNICNIILGNN